jgi:hypothetical protein
LHCLLSFPSIVGINALYLPAVDSELNHSAGRSFNMTPHRLAPEAKYYVARIVDIKKMERKIKSSAISLDGKRSRRTRFFEDQFLITIMILSVSTFFCAPKRRPRLGNRM